LFAAVVEVWTITPGIDLIDDDCDDSDESDTIDFDSVSTVFGFVCWDILALSAIIGDNEFFPDGAEVTAVFRGRFVLGFSDFKKI
jgi:hypothetical protein